jgi:predicted nucleic acid-binding protein
MGVVSNTSPISNLAIIGRLDLLRERYARVVIPSAVRGELLNLTHPAGRAAIEAALSDGWLVEEPVPAQSIFAELRASLDPGEAEAIALAASTNAEVLLLDERRGRLAARQRGLAVAGVLGELLYARNAGRLSSLRGEMERLKGEARFFIDAKIETFILSQAGE